MSSPRILLVDLSGIMHRNYAVNAGKGDVDAAANQTLSHVRWLANQYAHVAICCDSGRSFRHEIAKRIREWDPEHKGYKGKRPPADPVLVSQMRRVEHELYAEGFHVFRAAGFEADDVIATLCTWARANGHPVDVATEDKDLRSLVTDDPPQVRVIRKDGVVVGPTEVWERFKVPPERLIECLAIAGDPVDGVPGVAGLGKDKAAGILTAFGSFDAARQVAIDETADVRSEESIRKAQKDRGEKMDPLIKRKMQPATRAALVNGAEAYRVSLDLVTLRTDVPVDCTRALLPKERPANVALDAELDAMLLAATQAADAEDAALSGQKEIAMSNVQDAEYAPVAQEPSQPVPAAPAPVVAQPVAEAPAPQNTNGAPQNVTQKPAQSTALAKPTPVGPPIEFEKQLESRNLEQAHWLAKKIAASKKIKDAGDEDSVLLKLTVGRSLGMNLNQCLRLYLMEGQVVMRTIQVLARVKSSPLCEYIRCTHLDDKSCTWETKRRGEPVAKRTFTIEQAKRAMLGGIGGLDDNKKIRTEFDPKSAWAKWTEDMLSARALMPLMRQEYPEIADGYSMEELGADTRIIDTTGEAA
jgi:5'-3' exonuclease